MLLKLGQPKTGNLIKDVNKLDKKIEEACQILKKNKVNISYIIYIYIIPHVVYVYIFF